MWRWVMLIAVVDVDIVINSSLNAWNGRKSGEGGGDGRLWFLLYRRKYTPLYEKDIKETQNKPMETTSLAARIIDSNPTN